MNSDNIKATPKDKVYKLNSAEYRKMLRDRERLKKVKEISTKLSYITRELK